MNAIPTRYNGVQFRSRLEARYAAWFDIAGIPWQYEPIDLAGYIPDFIVVTLHGPDWARVEMLVEVKPAASIGELNDAAVKIEQSGWAGWALVFGRDPSICASRSEVGCCWMEGISHLRSKRHTWGPAEDPGSAIDELDELIALDWKHAGNRVQWRAPR